MRHSTAPKFGVFFSVPDVEPSARAYLSYPVLFSQLLFYCSMTIN